MINRFFCELLFLAKRDESLVVQGFFLAVLAIEIDIEFADRKDVFGERGDKKM